MSTATIVQADCLDFLRSQPPDSLDLVFGSPPYEQARLYLEGGVNMGISRKTDAWVAWMVEVYVAAQAACKGLVAFVVAGQTKQYRWSAGPALLMAELHRAGLNLRNPPIFHRVGIPGSGGPDWLRADYEWIVCTTMPGKLPWSDNTACGHPPQWAPGGAMSYRNAEGERKSAVGRIEAKNGDLKSRRRHIDKCAFCGLPQDRHGPAGESELGDKKDRLCPVNGVTSQFFTPAIIGRTMTVGGERSKKNGEVQQFVPPAKSNPGNIIKCIVGGGVMGNELCHENEAPFPEDLAEFFVLSFCPPGGVVCDPFSGSGTTAAMSVRHGRNFNGCDLRQSQVDLGLRRLETETPLALFD